MSSEAFLEAVEDALATDPDNDPWIASEEADRFTDRAHDFTWRYLRHLIQTLRERFLDWKKYDGPPLDQRPTGAAHSNGAVAPTGWRPCRPEPRTLTTNLLDWGRTYLPDHFQKPPSPMHQWMAQHLDEMVTDRGRKQNVLGPRGGAKSTVATLAYPLREALHAREPYIWIISDTAHQARAHLDNLKAELLDNELISHAYPQAVGKGPVWRAEKIVLRNGVTIEAFGTGQRIRGRRARANRPTLIICDDLQNDRHMESTVQRHHTRTWFHGTLLKAGTPQTNVINLATALHREALAMELTQTPGWHSKIFRSIDPWPFNTTLWEQWEQIYSGQLSSSAGAQTTSDPRGRLSPSAERTTPDTPSPETSTNQSTPAPELLNPEPRTLTTPSDPRQEARLFYEKHKTKMDAGSSVLWPQVEDLYTLMCLRAESGRSAFEREKQNSPLNPEICEWPEQYFTEKIWFDDWPANPLAKVIALDPSKGGDAHRGDYSAFISMAVDQDGTLYVQADMARRPTPQMVADGVELYRQFKPHMFGVEANQFQELLAPEFATAFRQQGLLDVNPWLINNDANKRVRIRRLGPLLAARRIRLKTNCPSTKLLLHQLQEFPIADHDDGPDALEMAVRLATELLSNNQRNDGLGNRLPVETYL